MLTTIAGTLRIWALLLALPLLARPAPDAAGQEADTFTLSIGGYYCNADPTAYRNAACEPAEGVGIAVTLEDGTPIGTCMLENVITPYGGEWSICGVEGVPFNTTIEVAEDLATVRPGYAPLDNPQIYETPSFIPGGGESTVITFHNVQLGERTGHQSGIFAGSCDEPFDWFGWPIDVVAPVGAPLGQATAMIPETGFASVAQSLDSLLAEPHAIAVMASPDADSPVIACGDLGAVADEDGVAAIGLWEVDESGYTGVAYLATSADRPGWTDVSIFLVKGRDGAE